MSNYSLPPKTARIFGSKSMYTGIINYKNKEKPTATEILVNIFIIDLNLNFD